MTALNILSDPAGSAGISRFELAELMGSNLRGYADVVWVFCDQNDLWCVRLEGGPTESFRARDDAVSFAHTLGEVLGPHRVFLQGMDGRFVQRFVDPDRTGKGGMHRFCS